MATKIDSNIVMAISSPHDVVNNPQSMEAQPIDILGNKDTTAAPHGAIETVTTSNTPDNNEVFPPPQKNGSLNQSSYSDPSISQANASDMLQPDHQESTEDQGANHQDAKAESNHISFENQENETFEVGSFKSTGFDGSIGSDTDTSKVEAGGNDKDAVPRYTAKKPSGFKPVSVTKSFLAKAGTSILPLKAVGDKGVSSPSSPAPGSATSVARPRLVAKTLSSSRSAAPKASNSGFKQAGADGPDPNQVWNRNRVQMAPQATPKHMTDEELRQQYGIQLASRPLEGGDSNQAKWADLEDEDEDWAPESLEWSDGTKINLAPSEPSTPANAPIDSLNSDRATAQAEAEKVASMPKISLGPKATVLKLGGSISQPKTPPSIPANPSMSKTTNEKPTLVAKSSPAPPAKSPWAQLPPVDKVSPIAPPVQAPPSRFPHREGYNRDSMAAHPLQPTREIAADDYSRFPANGTSRELFNSHNGRYEPAPESRRLSMKKDGGFRAPAVLQRPSHNDINAPVEQSPAFQQNKMSQDSNSWMRRRASSNVSNDSGPFARRTSMNRSGHDGFGRRDSVQDQSIASCYGPYHPENRVGSPAISHGISATSQQSPMTDHASMVMRPDQYSGNQIPGTPATPITGNIEVELARQKKLMQERAKAAMKRRQEEEAREEAEKRERLRLKLQELEPKNIAAPESPAQPPAQPVEAETSTPAQDQIKNTSPPKPPMPNLSGQPQQYGLMKLHGVNQSTTNVGADGRLSQVSPPQEPGSRFDGSRGQEFGSHSQIPTIGAVDAKPMSKTMPTPIGHQFEKDTPVSQNHRLPNQSGSSAYQSSAWGQTGMASHSTSGVNVWAAPGSQKTLGNGDFNKNVTQIHLPPVSSQQYPQHLATSQTQPQPIGTPRQVTHNQSSQSQVSTEHQNQSHQYSQDHSLHPGHPRIHGQLPILSSDVPASVNVTSGIQNRPPGISAWNDFAKNASTYDAQKKAQIAQEAAALGAQQAPIMHETWTQVARSDTLGSRRPINSTSTQRDLGAGDVVIAPASQGSHKGSRYKYLFDQNELSAVEPLRPEGPLTPPPEEGDHPVFIGDTQRPKVRLPGPSLVDTAAKPIPIVRLPDANAYKHASSFRSITQVNRQPSSPLRRQPVFKSIGWQERFNGLLGNTSQRRPAEVPGFSTSKEPFEHLQIPHTSVSLPPQDNNVVESIATKSVEEEMALLEEGRDFGSVPPVRIPTQAPIQVWNPPRQFKDMKRVRAAILNDDQVQGRSIFSPHEFHRSGEIALFIKLPYVTGAKRIPYTPPVSSRLRHSFQGGRGGKSRNTSGQHHGGNKSREGSASAASQSPSTSHSGRPSQHGSSSRKSSAQGHTGNWSTGGTKRSVPAPATVH